MINGIGNNVTVMNGKTIHEGVITGTGEENGQLVIDYQLDTGEAYWAYFSQILSSTPSEHAA